MPTSRAFRIAFYDSGVGGLPYFERTASLMPESDYCYLADSAHFPLGEKKREEVLGIVRDAVDAIITLFAPHIVVIACNTASLAALAELRSDHPGIAFVGTVPAVKPAALRSKSGKIAVIATARTIEDPTTGELVRQFASGLETHLVAAPGWVEFVERRWLASSLEERIQEVSPIVDGLVSMGVDEIVLACTHFLFLEDAISRRSGGSVEVIDSAQGVSRRVVSLCEGRDDGEERRGKGIHRFYSRGPKPEAGHAEMAARFGLEYGGPIP